MQNNTTKIVAAIIAILAIGGIATFALSGNKPADQMVKDTMSKTSEVMSKEMMMKKEEATKMVADKMAMEKEAMMKKDTMSKSSSVDAMKKDGEKMMSNKSSWSPEEMKAMEMDPNHKSMDDKMMKEGDNMSKDTMKKTGEVSSPKGVYAQYSVNALAQNSTGINIIFFHAPWCPTCKAAEADINANLDKIPENFQILKTDFDTSTELKKKYGVTSQSTFVKVDKDGNKLSLGNGFTKLADIVAFGQK